MAKTLDTFADEDDEGLNIRVALKFIAWASVAASAAALVILVARTETGAQRLAHILYGPTRAAADARPVDKVNPLAARLAETESEASRLAETVRHLTADRDKVLARIDALERNIDVTGSIHEGATVRDATSAPAPVAGPSAVANQTPSPTATTNTPAPSSTAGPTAVPATGAAPAKPGAIMLPSALFAPPPPTTPLAASSPAPSEAAKPAAANTAVDSVATKTEFGVDLGGDRTVDALRALWTSLRAGRHASLFTGLRPLVAIREVGKSGAVELRLVVGPVVNAGAAARLCGTLAAQGLACQPAVFDGQRLALR